MMQVLWLFLAVSILPQEAKPQELALGSSCAQRLCTITPKGNQHSTCIYGRVSAQIVCFHVFMSENNDTLGYALYPIGYRLNMTQIDLVLQIFKVALLNPATLHAFMINDRWVQSCVSSSVTWIR